MQGQRFTSFSPRSDLPRLEAAFRAPSAPSEREGSWYEIQNAGAESEVFIYGPIGDYGVTADDFVRDFAGIRAQRITVRVNSEGGNVFDGFAIYNALSRHPAEVTAVVDGLAASAASYIVMGADRVVMAKRSQLMIHKASGLAFGNADDMAKMSEVLAKFDSEIASVYVDKAGGTVAEWLDRMQAETWFNAQESLDIGLADEVLGQEPQGRVSAVVNEAPEPTPEVETPPEPVVPVVVDFKRVLAELEEAATARLFAETK